ncbi:conjugal transfer protein TraE [Helicobacter pullorum]|uniref:Conjugal transfer protein TraE n=1 Tax=Helicobacter pullorum TaxID=35818 RepID=A0AAW3J895_9HELI|nr:TraE/TraK family type IV conjugative transfer system protein [Helicobacter pullorum]EDO9587332.1 conjugal transfer protein TraE [Campylobacter coli]EKM9864842.1 conjugal transfer protein TraE [Campylobacter coli]ELT5464871.1 conjugal transfer protein TraE [Campylobacter coli]KAB0574440.1 conjugal transfer protein TraE [Helicobacter pullorum NCTC 12824]KPH50062.1 conjugal transfer protein TraE [Helicobacter pullorum]
MLEKFYKNKLDRYIFENITFRIITIALLMIIIYLVWILSTRINEQKIVFMPPKVITQEMWVKGNEVSKSYLQDMGQFIASNLLNITKDNAKNNVDNIMHLIEPQFYNKVRAELIAQTEYIINNSISRTFFVSSVNADTKGLIKVMGVIKDIIGDKVVNSENYIVEIGYKMEQGRFWINSIDSKNEFKRTEQ